jgi:hypothetical protein
MYPVSLIDAIVIKVRDSQVANRPVYVVIGVNMDGERDVLGLWLGPSGGEGAKQWMTMLTELRNRGVVDALIVCCDGLKGLPDAIRATWPEVTVQMGFGNRRADSPGELPGSLRQRELVGALGLRRPLPIRERLAGRVPGDPLFHPRHPFAVKDAPIRSGSLFDALLQANLDGLAGLLPDRFADVGLHGKLVRSIAHRHERTPEWVAVDRAPDLHQPLGPEELDRVGHDHVGPAALVGTLLQGGSELLLQVWS